MAHGQGGAEIGFDRGPTLTCNHEAPIAAYGIRTANTSSNGWGIQEEITHTLDGAMGIAVAHSLRGEGFDAGEDGTGRGTPLVPVGVTIHGTDPTVQKVASYDDVAQCLRARTPGNIDNSSTTVVQQPVAFDTTQITSATNRCNPQAAQEVGRPAHGQGQPAHGGMQVRRLTAEECEFLQGFPRGHTLIPWRGKPASECPDGPRYRALGNSWAVPVARWIGKRIEQQMKHEAIYQILNERIEE